MKLIEIQERIAGRGLLVFSRQEFRGFMDLSETASQKLLERYTKKRILVRLRNGFYMLSSKPAHSFAISNKIYQPSYVSFESALSFHRLIPETVYEISAATTRTTMCFVIGGRAFAYHKIKRGAYSGYEPTRLGGEVVYIASREKALVDYLYLVSLGRKPLYERLILGNLDKRRAMKYARLFARSNLEELLDKLLERKEDGK